MTLLVAHTFTTPSAVPVCDSLDVIAVPRYIPDFQSITGLPRFSSAGCNSLYLTCSPKSQIAVSSSDARPSRFVGGERIDAAISELNHEKRKVTLSIKLLEELQNKEAVSKFSSPLSGKNLPFSSLSDKLSNKKEKK